MTAPLSHTRVPKAARDLCQSRAEMACVYWLWDQADEARGEPFRMATRDFREALLSSGAATRLLKALTEAGLLVVLEKGRGTTPSLVAVRDATTGLLRSEEASAERKASATRAQGERKASAEDADEDSVSDGVENATRAQGERKASANGALNARAGNSLHPTASKDPPIVPLKGDPACELTKAGIEPAWQKRLKAAGHETVAAVQALTLDDLKRIPGVGRKTAQGIADAMKANGTPISEPRPEQPDPEQQKRNRDERATSDAFGAAWFEVHGTKYQWSLKPNSPERAKRKAVCDLFGVDADDEATHQRLRRVAAAYLADHAAGRAWPENGTATLTTFAAKASEYINADAIRQRRAAARKAEQATASTLVPTSSPIHAAAWASGNRLACRDAYKAGGWDGVRDFLGQRVTHPDNVIEQLRRQGAVKEAM